MPHAVHDLRHGWRALKRRPAFALLVVLTLGLAIGVNSAIFSMVSVIFFSDLPLRDGETLGFVHMENPEQGVERGLISLAELLAVRERVAAFEAVGAARERTVVLSGDGEPARILAGEVTANLFDVWRIPPAAGRDFAAGEDAPGAERVAILSHGAWQRRFGGDPEALGRTIELDGFPTTVVGVMPEELEFGDLSLREIWLPLPLDRGEAEASRGERELWVTARRAPGVSHEEAEQELRALAARLAREHPESNAGWSADLRTFNEGLADDSFWTILFMLALTVGFVMLIACSNVATLTLARATVRAPELAVREALGAGRWRIVRQLLVEGALLSLAAGAVGLGVARAALSGMVWMAGADSGMTTFTRMLAIDREVLLFTLAVSLLAPLLFGFLPALRVSRQRLAETLREGSGRSVGDRSSLRGQRFLVGAQVALALTLVVVSGVLIRSMAEVYAEDLGYDPDRYLTLRLDLPEGRYPEAAARLRFFDDVIERVRALPEVEVAAWVSRRPLAEPPGRTSFRIAGRPEPDPERLPWAGVVVADPEYFRVLELPVLRGRGFRESDRTEAVPVAVINRATAERYWPDGDPVGARLRLVGAEGEVRPIEVVGVVASEIVPGLEDPDPPGLYLPLAQSPRPALGLVVRPGGRGASDPYAAVPAIREAVWAVDPDQPVGDVRTIGQIQRDNLAAMRTILSLFAAFAVFALVMASAGLYGVLSFAVARRTRELGIRSVLGAGAGELRGMVLRQSATVVGVGLLVGAGGGFALSRLLAAGVPELEPAGLLVQGGSALALAAVAALAAWIPAQRATRVDPLVALRTE